MPPSRTHETSLALRLALGCAVATALGCNLVQQEETTPAAPTPVTLAPLSIPVIGTPTPAPAPNPTPNPTPGPTPEPTPEPTPPPTASACNLPPSSPPRDICSPESSGFLGQVDKAITRVTEQHPSLFDLRSTRCENCYLVRDAERFTEEVVKELERRGFCAVGGEEIGVKNTNAFNEQFDIILSSGHIRRGAGSYRVTCRPAAF